MNNNNSVVRLLEDEYTKRSQQIIAIHNEQEGIRKAIEALNGKKDGPLTKELAVQVDKHNRNKPVKLHVRRGSNDNLFFSLPQSFSMQTVKSRRKKSTGSTLSSMLFDWRSRGLIVKTKNGHGRRCRFKKVTGLKNIKIKKMSWPECYNQLPHRMTTEDMAKMRGCTKDVAVVQACAFQKQGKLVRIGIGAFEKNVGIYSQEKESVTG